MQSATNLFNKFQFFIISKYIFKRIVHQTVDIPTGTDHSATSQGTTARSTTWTIYVASLERIIFSVISTRYCFAVNATQHQITEIFHHRQHPDKKASSMFLQGYRCAGSYVTVPTVIHRPSTESTQSRPTRNRILGAVLIRTSIYKFRAQKFRV